MQKHNLTVRNVLFSPITVLFIILIPIAILINPEIIPRLKGESIITGYMDLTHYISLAENINEDSWRTAFFPLWPYLIKISKPILKISSHQTAIFLSAITGLICLLISKYVFSKVVNNPRILNISWHLYVLSPMTVFFFVGYTEAIFSLESWVLINSIVNIIKSKRYKKYYNLNYLVIVTSSILINLTRPTLIQTIFALSLTMLITYFNYNGPNFKRYIHIFIAITIGSFIGYAIYGSMLMHDGFRFLEPFYAQGAWKKSFGIRPIYLLTSRSPLIDYWGLYYPFLIICTSIQNIKIINIDLSFIRFALLKNLYITLLYPPIGFIYGLISKTSSSIEKKAISTRKDEKELEINNSYKELEFVFWYTILFAFSHSLICLLTQPFYMKSLGRYVFGQPYFYIALSIMLCNRDINIIRKPKKLYYGAILISTGLLFKHFLDFGHGKLLP